MQIGLCLNMAARDAQKLGTGLLPDIEKSGWDYIEISVMNTMALTRDEFKSQVLEPVRAQKLPCRTMNAFCGADQQFVHEPQKALEYTREALERASLLGAGVIVIGAGVARSTLVGDDREQSAEKMAELFRKMGEMGAEYGVRFALEGLNRGETNMFYNMDDVMREVALVDHPNVGALVDYYHFTLGNEDYEKLTPMVDRIIHAHIARMVGRIFPQNAAEDDGYLRFLSALQKGGYKGNLSLEAFCPQEFYPAAKRGLCVLRELCEKAGF